MAGVRKGRVRDQARPSRSFAGPTRSRALKLPLPLLTPATKAMLRVRDIGKTGISRG